MDYEQLKSEVVQISEIAAAVPEAFREKCFELLMAKMLAESGLPASPAPPFSGGTPEDGGSGGTTPFVDGSGGASIPLQAQVRVFLAKTGVTPEQLGRVVMMDGDQVHFVREPSPSAVATGQIEWALLLALKAGIETNKLETDPEAVRSICQDKGYYDKGNFASYFKKAKSASYFKGVLEPQGAAQGLTAEGIDALGKLVKSLAGAE